jgi:hypothetical protein
MDLSRSRRKIDRLSLKVIPSELDVALLSISPYRLSCLPIALYSEKMSDT